MLIQLRGVSKSFGEHLVLHHVEMAIDNRGRYGLIGPNGAGKSTLLNIITGDLEADEGELSVSGSVSIGFLRQDSGLTAANTIYGEMHSVFSGLLATQERLRELSAALEKMAPASPDYQAISQEYTELQNYFEVNDGYNIDVKIKTVLNGMGFEDRALDTSIDILSGGEKTRLALAKLLLEEPNLLILDEPTNHLDFRTLSWLEDYLGTYSGAILVVSHDRYFLDNTVSVIYEMDYLQVERYNGNYSKYLQLKEERLERAWKEYEAQQKEIEKMEDYIRRNIARASTSNSAKSRVKALERMDILSAPPKGKKRIKLTFDVASEPYKDLLDVQDVELTVGAGKEKKTLCSQVSFQMKKGEKVALIGRNGVGKSTLLKALQKQHPIEAGKIRWGENTIIAYFEQEVRDLNPHKTVIDELWDRNRLKTEFEIRSRLGSVGLTGENVFKKVGVLSGGEKAKLKFCILSYQSSNMLIMDEPTNHLDLPAKEILEDALSDYPGSLLFVSHDRYLLNKVPTKIIELTDNGMVEYLGNYEAYRAAVEKRQIQAASGSNGKKEEKESSVPAYRSKKQRSLEVKRKQEIADVEERIAQTELDIAALEQEIALEEVYSDYVLMQEKCAELEDTKELLNQLLLTWEELLASAV